MVEIAAGVVAGFQIVQAQKCETDELRGAVMKVGADLTQKSLVFLGHARICTSKVLLQLDIFDEQAR